MKRPDQISQRYTYKSAVPAFQKTLDLAVKYGFNVHKECRFYRFLRTYKKIKTKIDAPQLDREILDGMRDAFELKIILETRELVDTAREEINQLFSGNVITAEDKNHTSRNKQFQLFMNALFINSQYMTTYEEPDFSFMKDGRTYSVAVKRIVNSKNIAKRIKEADKQISKYEHDGFIIISLDRLVYEMFDKTFIILASNPDLYTKAAEDVMFQISRKYLTSTMIHDLSERIKCLVITFGSPIFNPVECSLGYGFKIHFMPIVDDENDPNFHYYGSISEELGNSLKQF